MSEFIETKSPKAKGKRFSTLEIAKIEDITPEPEIVESEEEQVLEDDEMGDIESTEVVVEENSPIEKEATAPNDTQTSTVVDVPFTITNEVPEDSKLVEEQLSLF
jgi:hypothetical protein